MTLEKFRAAAKNTGLPFDKFFLTYFLRSSAYINEREPVFIAETLQKLSKPDHVSLYYPNKFGGATLVKGYGKEKEIMFFDCIEDIHA